MGICCTTIGPSQWAKTYPIAIDGKRQSPINITPDVVTSGSHDKLQVTYPEEVADQMLKNTGYGWTVQISPDVAATTSLRGGPLNPDHQYILEQFHAHWGGDCSCGSEHTLDGKSFPGELHLVHWNKSLFTSFGEAASQDKGLSVVGVFLDVGHDPHPQFEKLCSLMQQIQFKSQEVTMNESLNLAQLLPPDRSYWCYQGSLTTPPLFESVDWILMREPILLSPDQFDIFRSLMCIKPEDALGTDGDDKFRLNRNFRPTQPLCGRSVTFNSV